MRLKGGLSVALASVLLAGALSACGDEEVSYADKDIIERLNLVETDDGYAIDGDPFCEIESKLLNDAIEVEEARDGRNGELVISSREGNVGVKVRPGFAPDCAQDARKKLNKLDPAPTE